jgi:hypothetical protein
MTALGHDEFFQILDFTLMNEKSMAFVTNRQAFPLYICHIWIGCLNSAARYRHISKDRRRSGTSQQQSYVKAVDDPCEIDSTLCSLTN